MNHKSLLAALILTTSPTALGAADSPAPTYHQLVEQRIREGVEVISKGASMTSTKPSGQDVWKALMLLHENKNIEQAERYIIEFCGNPLTEYVGKPVPQVRNEALFRIYLTEKNRARLSAKTKTVIEDFAWLLLTKYNRDITRADADKPFWSFSSSENHYVNDRRRYTQALQIVRMSERFGPSHKLGDETIESHYQAWNAFWIRYFEARAGQGTDMEIAHPSSYGICTVGVYYDLFDFTDSPRLRELAGKFLTLYWAEIAAEFEPRTGIRALAATRNPAYDGVTTYWARGLLHAYGWHDNPMADASPGLLTFFLSSYRPHEILRAIASDPKRGPYQTTSRRALLIDENGDPGVIVLDKNGEGHFRRDVFYTPDYTLATMTLDPAKLYNGVGDLAQTMGVNFSSAIADRIIVMGTGYYAKRAINGVTGNAVSIIARDPNAQEGRGRFMSDGTRVFVSNGALWDNRVEDPSGWFFTRAGDAYAAIRISSGDYTATTRTYTWPGRKLQEVAENHGHHLELKDMWAPIVIQMGRAADYKSFEAFQASVKDNKLDYQEGKLTYASEANETFEVWSKGTQFPKINGAAVNLNPEKTYDSPFLSMQHGSNKAVIQYSGYDDVVLQF